MHMLSDLTNNKFYFHFVSFQIGNKGPNGHWYAAKKLYGRKTRSSRQSRLERLSVVNLLATAEELERQIAPNKIIGTRTSVPAKVYAYAPSTENVHRRLVDWIGTGLEYFISRV